MSVNLTITNNTSDNAYYIVWGFTDTLSIDNAPWAYLEKDGSNASKLTPFPTPPKKVQGASKSNVSLITELKSGTSVEFKNIPHIISGNVLLSFKERPELFNVVPAWNDPNNKATISKHGGWGVQSPGFKSGDADANTIFCSSEFTLDNSGVWVDTTNVDYFSAPVTVKVMGSSGTQTSGTLNAGVTRDDVFKAFTGITGEHLSGFNNLIMSNNGHNIRILAPGHAIPSALAANYYDEYVSYCLSLFTASNPLTVKVSGTFDGTYQGIADPKSNTISFVNSKNNENVGSITIPAGSAQSIFLCDGALSAPNNTIGAITAIICAALNRTVLHKSSMQPYCNSNDFYDPTDESKSWWATNWYSKLLHDKIAKVYGFAFDDVCNDKYYKPLLHEPNPTSVTITLDSWS